MKSAHYISRGIAAVLLLVMIYSCCSDGNEIADCCKKSCDENKNKKQDSGCQKEHLALFGTFGQFHFIKSIKAKIFQPLVSLLNTEKNILSVISTEIHFAFNGFHPPPPKENIIILNQSFLI